MKDYSKLKQMLEDQEAFPLQFTFKFIGRSSTAFATSTKVWELSFPGLRHQGTRASSNGQHTSVTYIYEAPDADTIIAIYRAIEKIEDILIVL